MLMEDRFLSYTSRRGFLYIILLLDIRHLFYRFNYFRNVW